jgi:dienelactone hydrolase
VLLVRVGNGERLGEDEHLAGHLAAAGIGTAMIGLGPRSPDSRGRGEPQGLADRVRTAAAWLKRQPEAAGLPVGGFAAGAGVAAVLAAAASSPILEALVVRGGRPDLVDDLAAISAPTLILAGGRDEEGIGFARIALAKLAGPKRLVAIRGAGRRFADVGALDEAGHWTAAWFVQHLAMARTWRPARSGVPTLRFSPARV